MICENDTERTLWRNYITDRSVANRNALVEYYYPRCFRFGKRYSRKVSKGTDPSNDVFDYTNDAVLGLIDAVERFDTLQKTKFITYSTMRVYGQIHDEARRQSGFSPFLIRRQRLFDKKMTNPNADQEKVIQNVFGSRKRYEKHQRTMQTQRRSKLGLLNTDRATTDKDIRQVEIDDFRDHVIRCLEEPELQAVFNLLYIEGMTKTDTAQKMGMSWEQVRWRNKKIIEIIKELFSESELRSLIH